jgi:hypothetical protein
MDVLYDRGKVQIDKDASSHILHGQDTTPNLLTHLRKKNLWISADFTKGEPRRERITEMVPQLFLRWIYFRDIHIFYDQN